MRLSTAVAVIIIVFAGFQARTARAGLVFSLDPAVTNTTPGTVAVDLLASHDGIGESTFSSITIDFVVGNGGTLLDDSAPSNPLNFELPSILNGRLAFSSFFSEVNLGQNGSATLTTLNFGLPTIGEYSIELDVVNANRGTLPNIEAIDQSQLFAQGGTITAIPEPSSAGLLGLVVAAISLRRGRRQSR